MAKRQITYQGGPLNGRTVSLAGPGRWPAARDAHGKSIPVSRVDRAVRLRRGLAFYVNAVAIPTTDGTKHRRFDWWDDGTVLDPRAEAATTS